MSRLFFTLFLALVLVGCGSKKRTYSATRTVHVEPEVVTQLPSQTSDPVLAEPAELASPKVESIIDEALSYAGTRYRYGGTTRDGMDCSGLLYVAFASQDVALPRVSADMARTGKQVRIPDVVKGDLLFFNTRKRGRKINHVGLVVAVDDYEIKFVHASTSRGVIVSSLREGYWNHSFVKATRVL